MSIKCILLVIVPLFLVYKFYPNFFWKIVNGLFGSILSSRINHDAEQKSENGINWSTLCMILLITFVITFVSCVLLKHFNCGLYLFYTGIVTCLIVEVSLSVYISFNHEGMKKELLQWLEESFDGYSDPENRNIRTIWNDVQSLLKCCGIFGRDSWYKHEKYILKTYNSTLPNSCCETQVPCLRGKLNVAQSYTDDCYEKSKIYFEENVEFVIWTFSGLAVVKVAAVLLSNYYFVQLDRVFQISSSKFVNKMNNNWSSKKCQSSNDISLEKV